MSWLAFKRHGCDRRGLRRALPGRGFTLMELLVVTAIFMILSSIVLANHSRFGSQVVLQNLAHDIALSIRQAQVYGIAVQRYGTDTFDAGYGIHFNAASPNSYTLYADVINVGGTYDDGEAVRSTMIEGGFAVSELCATPLSGMETCGLTQLDILYIRPEPDAFIRVNGASTLYREARITVLSNRGDTQNIIVDATGQIYVQ